MIKPISIATLITAVGVAGGEAVHNFDIPAADAIGTMTATGFVLWYAWYVTARALPKRDEQFTGTIRDLLKSHADDRAKFQCHAEPRHEPG